MTLPALGAYTSPLDSWRDRPDPGLDDLRERASRRPSNAALLAHMHRIEARWGNIGIGLAREHAQAYEQAQALVQARWLVDRAWEVLAGGPDTARHREEAEQFAREAELLSAFLRQPSETGALTTIPGSSHPVAPPSARQSPASIAGPKTPPVAQPRSSAPAGAEPTPRMNPSGLVIEPGVREDERQCAEAFFAQLPAPAMQAIRAAMTIRIVGTASRPLESEPCREGPCLSTIGPRARFDETQRTLRCAGTPESWNNLRTLTRRMVCAPGCSPLPVLWYALGRALEASTTPRGAEAPDYVALRMDSDWPESVPRPDETQKAAELLGRGLAGIGHAWPELHRFVERMIGQPIPRPVGRSAR